VTLVERWARENPNSRTLHGHARDFLAGGVTHDVRWTAPFPLSVKRAYGSRKWDVDGHELVCYVMGHGSLLFGHGHREVIEAVKRQAGVFLHPGASHELERLWAEQIVALVPSAELVRFTSSGTEAAMLGIQVARAWTGRTRVAKLAGHFHGWHDYAAFGVDPPFERPTTPSIPSGVADSVTVLPAALESLATVLRDGDVAALVLEPSGAGWGQIPLPSGFLAGARQLTAAHGTLLIFDEVVSGFRWAPGGVQEVEGVPPDLTVLAKIVAGGLPGGALAGRADVMEVLAFRGLGEAKVSHPGTHNAHPLAAAAGTATLGRLGDGRAQAHAAARAKGLRSALSDVLRRRGAPGLVHGESSTFILVLGDEGPPEALDAETLKRGVTGQLGAELHCGMLLNGVQLFHAAGFLSTEHTDEDVVRTVAAFENTITSLQEDRLLAG
jgi:glutamate-1-semialdehyde 2,1-aminomutase